MIEVLFYLKMIGLFKIVRCRFLKDHSSRKEEGLPDGSGYPAEAGCVGLWRSSSVQPGLLMIRAGTVTAQKNGYLRGGNRLC